MHRGIDAGQVAQAYVSVERHLVENPRDAAARSRTALARSASSIHAGHTQPRPGRTRPRSAADTAFITDEPAVEDSGDRSGGSSRSLSPSAIRPGMDGATPPDSVGHWRRWSG